MDRVDRLHVLGIGKPAAKQLRVAADDHQEIVEVVGDAARQLAERFHLLRLGELLLRALERSLRLPPLGDVARDLHEADERPTSSRTASMTALAQNRLLSRRTRQPSTTHLPS